MSKGILGMNGFFYGQNKVFQVFDVKSRVVVIFCVTPVCRVFGVGLCSFKHQIIFGAISLYHLVLASMHHAWDLIQLLELPHSYMATIMALPYLFLKIMKINNTFQSYG